MLLILTSCTSIRPITKLGLIAPFEGLYRESGYAALEGTRQAINDCTPPGLDVLPLALDDNGDPAQAQRAAQKLLVDPTVRAVVGPFLFDTVPAVSAVMSSTATTGAPAWIVPMLIDPTGGYVDPTSPAWLRAQINYVAEATASTRVLLLGLPAVWDGLTGDTPSDAAFIDADVPTQRIDDLATAHATVKAGDAILWLGRPDVGAQWHQALQQANPTVEFWLAEQAGGEVFGAHIQDQRATYWLHWTRSSYNLWSQPPNSAIQPTDAMRDLAYHAACAALVDMGRTMNEDMHKRPPVTADWELRGLHYAPLMQ